MDLSLGNLVGIGMRVITHRNEVARVAQKVIAQINQAEELWGEVRAVLEKVAPELLVDLHVGPVVPVIEPHAFDVTWVQRSLNHLMHGEGVRLKVDGLMGDQTRDAIKLYQAYKGVTIDGWLGPVTLAALEADIRGAHAGASR